CRGLGGLAGGARLGPDVDVAVSAVSTAPVVTDAPAVTGASAVDAAPGCRGGHPALCGEPVSWGGGQPATIRRNPRDGPRSARLTMRANSDDSVNCGNDAIISTSV